MPNQVEPFTDDCTTDRFGKRPCPNLFRLARQKAHGEYMGAAVLLRIIAGPNW